MNAAIVLAAGRSRRMGAPKVLLPFGPGTVIAHIADRIAASSVDRIVVVVGPEGDRVADALRGRPASIVVNPDPEKAMLSSVRCGLRALPEGCDAVLVALGDQPAVEAALIDRLIAARAGSGKGIAVPVHGGRRGHPLLFAASYGPEVLERYEDTGLRGLLAAHPDDIVEVPASDAAVLSDMDTPEDYRRELDRRRGGD